jgi:hypothetical protein
MQYTSTYKAFISYSHRDETWAKWLHKALESYRLPPRLKGDSIPKKLYPVFRDRDELSSAANLSSKVQEGLSNSGSLVVICSPAAAQSRWVNEEIRLFRSLGRTNRIFCVIVDGDPQASRLDEACFPPALLEGGVGESAEPLAADARKWADGKLLAKLKLIAGILDVPLDHLRRRDLQKRQKIWTLALAASIAAIAIVVIAISARMAAQQRRDSGESLVAYKLNELRTLLNVTVDPEELSRLNEWKEHELAELIASAGTEKNDLLNKAMVFREEGIALWEDGDLGSALEKFRSSWALLAKSYRRGRADGPVIHGVFRVRRSGLAGARVPGPVFRRCGAVSVERAPAVASKIPRLQGPG